MAGVFTKRIWQPCICQPNELKREIKKKTGGGQTQGQAKIWGATAHPDPLRIATGFGYLFLKKIGSGQDLDICLVSITQFSCE